MKLNEQELDKLIMEALNEDLAFNKKINYDKDALKKLEDDAFNVKINKELKPKPDSPEYPRGTDVEKAYKRKGVQGYKDALDKISKLDDDPANISTKDVAASLTSKDKPTRAVGIAIGRGEKFQKPLYFRLMNLSINKHIDELSGLEEIASKFDKDEYVTQADVKLANQKFNEFVKKAGDTFRKEYTNQVEPIIKKGIPKANAAKQRVGRYALGTRTGDVFKAIQKCYTGSITSPQHQNRLGGITGAEFTSEHNFKVLERIKQKDNDAALVSLKRTRKTTPPFFTKNDAIRINQLFADGKDYTYLAEPSFPDSSEKEERQPADPFGRLAVSYTGLSPRGATFGDVKTGLKKFDLRIDPSLNATINAIEGKGLLEKLQKLSDFALNIDKKLDSDMHIGKTSSYLRMLNFLSDAAREYESASAGTVFETFLAAMGKGIIIGGESGAADVITFSNGNPIYYSAKFYADNQVSQSDQAETGFTAVAEEATKNAGQGLVYIIGIKTNLSKSAFASPDGLSFAPGNTGKTRVGEADFPKSIGIVVLKTTYVDDSFVTTALTESGKVHNVGVLKRIQKGEGKKVSFNEIMTEVLDKNYWFAHIPIFDDIQDAAGRAAETGAQYIANKVNNSSNNALSSLMKSYNNLREMELTSEEYTAKASDAEFTDHVTFINKIQTEYTGFKDNYNLVIDQIAGDVEDRITGDVEDRIKENKKISEIILDKLIQEVILKK